jgi:hypothetical protein
MNKIVFDKYKQIIDEILTDTQKRCNDTQYKQIYFGKLIGISRCGNIF